MARGPIPHTCPDINKRQSYNGDILKELKEFDKYPMSVSLDDIVAMCDRAADALRDNDSFLEEMRGSNEELRSWGAQQEDEKQSAEEEIERLRQELSDLQSAYDDQKSELQSIHI